MNLEKILIGAWPITSWLSVPAADQVLLNLTSRLVAEESMNKAINNGEMDQADVAFFTGKTKQASVASNEETAMSARGGHSSHRRGGRGYRGRGYRGSRHDYKNRPHIEHKPILDV